MTNATDLERSTFQDLPAYRYIRKSDEVPALGHTAEEHDPIARVKLFNPSGSWTWYVVEYDPESRIAFGLVDGFEREAGNFSMEEIVELRSPPFGLPIERDIHWTPRKLSEC